MAHAALTTELRAFPKFSDLTEAAVVELTWRTQQRAVLALLGDIPAATSLEVPEALLAMRARARARNQDPHEAVCSRRGNGRRARPRARAGLEGPPDAAAAGASARRSP